jgi:hypothetical protein
MSAAQRRIEVPDHVAERDFQGGAAPDQNIIVVSAKRRLRRQPHDFAQPAAHAVTLDRITHLLGDREADPRRIFAAARSRLQDERTGMGPRALSGSPKIRPAFQPLHETDFM